MTFPSLYYFVFYGALAFLAPFLAVFFQSRGLSGTQIGVLTALAPLVSMIGAPLWTGTADATHRHKAVLAVATFGVAVVTFFYPYVWTFSGFFVMSILFSFFYSPGASIVDSAVLVMLGDRKERYGRVRLWGTVSYGILALFIPTWIDRYGLKWSFWGFSIFMLMCLLAIIPIPFRQSRSTSSFSSGMRVLFSNRPFMLFLAMVFIGAVGQATVNNYLFVFMKSLGSSDVLMGLALTVSTISEIPVLFFSNRLLQRFGARGLLVIALTVIGLRLVAFALVGQAWMAAAIMLVHGLTFGTIYVAGVHFADQVAPPGLQATAQGMFGATLLGLGSAAGGFIGGALMDHFTPGGMYGVMGAIVLVGLVVFLVVERLVEGKKAVVAEP